MQNVSKKNDGQVKWTLCYDEIIWTKSTNSACKTEILISTWKISLWINKNLLDAQSYQEVPLPFHTEGHRYFGRNVYGQRNEKAKDAIREKNRGGPVQHSENFRINHIRKYLFKNIIQNKEILRGEWISHILKRWPKKILELKG